MGMVGQHVGGVIHMAGIALLGDHQQEQANRHEIAVGRLAARIDEDIGRAVVALCGPDMGYLTGATIPLDGGQANFD